MRESLTCQTVKKKIFSLSFVIHDEMCSVKNSWILKQTINKHHVKPIQEIWAKLSNLVESTYHEFVINCEPDQRRKKNRNPKHFLLRLTHYECVRLCVHISLVFVSVLFCFDGDLNVCVELFLDGKTLLYINTIFVCCFTFFCISVIWLSNFSVRWWYVHFRCSYIRCEHNVIDWNFANCSIIKSKKRTCVGIFDLLDFFFGVFSLVFPEIFWLVFLVWERFSEEKKSFNTKNSEKNMWKSYIKLWMKPS